MKRLIPFRLVSEDDVAAIICKYENRSKEQHMMIYQLSALVGCLATEEQMLQILGEKELQLED